jgi:hypothetical protein
MCWIVLVFTQCQSECDGSRIAGVKAGERCLETRSQSVGERWSKIWTDQNRLLELTNRRTNALHDHQSKTGQSAAHLVCGTGQRPRSTRHDGTLNLGFKFAVQMYSHRLARIFLMQANGFHHFIHHLGGITSSRSRGNMSLEMSSKYHFASTLQSSLDGFDLP